MKSKPTWQIPLGPPRRLFLFSLRLILDLTRSFRGLDVMQAFARSIVDTVRHPLLVLDAGLRVVVANASFYRTFGSTASATEGHDLFEIDGGRWDQPRLRTLLKEVIPGTARSRTSRSSTSAPTGRRVMVLDAHRVARDDDGTPMVLLAIEDDTERRRVRNELRRLNRELERRAVDRTAELEVANQALWTRIGTRPTNRELEAFCYSVSHDLRSPAPGAGRVQPGIAPEVCRPAGRQGPALPPADPGRNPADGPTDRRPAEAVPRDPSRDAA